MDKFEGFAVDMIKCANKQEDTLLFALVLILLLLANCSPYEDLTVTVKLFKKIYSYAVSLRIHLLSLGIQKRSVV